MNYHEGYSTRQDMTYTAAIVLPLPSMILMAGSFTLLRASASYVLPVIAAKSQSFMSPTCRSHGHVILQENPRLTLRDLTTFRGCCGQLVPTHNANLVVLVRSFRNATPENARKKIDSQQNAVIKGTRRTQVVISERAEQYPQPELSSNLGEPILIP